MVKSGTLFEHLYPGKLFDLNQAIKICSENNYEIEAIGTMWNCLSRKEN